MVKLFGKEFEMDELRQYVGSMRQLSGARAFEYKYGRADGIKGIFEQTYPNAITSSETKAVKIPIVMPSDELAIKCAIKTCIRITPEGVKIIRIKNTLSMNEFFISEALLGEAERNKDIEIVSELKEMEFD